MVRKRQMPRRGPGQIVGDGVGGVGASTRIETSIRPNRSTCQDPVADWLFSAAGLLYRTAWRLRRAGLLRQAQRSGACAEAGR